MTDVDLEVDETHGYPRGVVSLDGIKEVTVHHDNWECARGTLRVAFFGVYDGEKAPSHVITPEIVAVDSVSVTVRFERAVTGTLTIALN